MRTSAASSDAGTDGFDSFAAISIDGVGFQQPNDKVDLTTTADGTFIATINPASLSGLDVSLDYFFDASSPTLRAFATLANPTDTAIDTTLTYGGNLGSDDNARVINSSNGDNVLDQATDRWFSSDDNNDGGDPTLTFIRFGDGVVETPSQATFLTERIGNAPVAFQFDTFLDEFDMHIGSGETESLLFFVQFDDLGSQPSTASIDARFLDLSTLQTAGLTAGLTDTQLSQTINFTAPLGGGPDPDPLPEPSSLVLYLLGAVMLAGVGRWWKPS